MLWSVDVWGENERLLLIDTCAEDAGVAVSVGEQSPWVEGLGERRASAEILGAVKRLLEVKGWTLAELDGVGVVSGPGSFTGVRTGLAAAKGLVEAGGLKLAAVSRLAVLAEVGGAELAMLDAGRGELYVREQRGDVAREWMCGVEELRTVAAGRRVVVAEDRVRERLAAAGLGEVCVRELTVADALLPVLKCLRAGGSDAATVDANYVRAEGDIYRRQATVTAVVRRARAEDFAAVLAIERECAEASHWSEGVWREMLAQGSDDGAARVVWVAERAGEVVGFAVVQSAGGSAELEGVAVKATARRRGVARVLCDAAMAWARARGGADEMYLEVRAGNAAALRLYAALGFRERGTRSGYYGDPVEDAVVMAREAGASASSSGSE